MSPLLKICRVETRLAAKMAAAADADYVGLHAPYSLTEARLTEFPPIVRWLRRHSPSTRPVLVTLSTREDDVTQWCTLIGLSGVQIHSQADPHFWYGISHALRDLPEEPFVVKNIVPSALDEGSSMRAVETWARCADVLLFDSSEAGGSGRLANWELVAELAARVGHRRTLLAGGISADNAAAAVKATRVAGLDAQSSLELGKINGRHAKSVKQILALRAAVDGVDQQQMEAAYRWRRGHPRLLWSPNELSRDNAEHVMGGLATSDVDGIQIDCSDGSEVAPWPVAAPEWAELAWNRAPEAPIWLHLFCNDLDSIKPIVEAVQRVNPHVVGLVVQRSRSCSPQEWLRVAVRVEAELGIPTTPSFTVGDLERLESKLSGFLIAIASSGMALQITAPSEPNDAVRRVSQLSDLAQRHGIWLQVDRGLTEQFIRDLRPKPRAVVLGRGLHVETTERLLHLLDER